MDSPCHSVFREKNSGQQLRKWPPLSVGEGLGVLRFFLRFKNYDEEIQSASVQPKNSRVWDLEAGILLRVSDEVKEYWFLDVKMLLCDWGHVRARIGALECVPCPLGTYNVYPIADTLPADADAVLDPNYYQPVACRTCFRPTIPGRYQDLVGQHGCKTCPKNTVTWDGNRLAYRERGPVSSRSSRLEVGFKSVPDRCRTSGFKPVPSRCQAVVGPVPDQCPPLP